jgi:predicted branched-subunit amino acid permease
MNRSIRHDQRADDGLATVPSERRDAACVNPAVSMLGPALRDIRTVLSGMIPFGVLLGVTIVGTGSDRIAGIVGALTVYGGSAQLTAVTLAARGLDLVTVVLTAAIVNLRLLLYSADLGRRFAGHPRSFRLLAPHFIIDQTYLMASGRPELAGAPFRRYWWWLGSMVLVCWTASIVVGMLVAPVLPPLPHLTLVGTALFIALLVPRLTNIPAVVAAVAGGGVAAAVSLIAPALGIIAGAAAGMAAALLVDARREVRS